MENTINYKEENENLRLKIELSKQRENESKQRENEMKIERELIVLGREDKSYHNQNVKSVEVVVDEPKTVDNAANIVKLAKAKDKVAKANVAKANVAKANVAKANVANIEKPNTNFERELILEAQKNSKPITLDNIKEMINNKNDESKKVINNL